MRTTIYFCVCMCLACSLSQAAERPTLLHTNDPRPDILPRPFYDNHTEYRARYNRPRFFTGFLAYEMSRTSQEAMVWKENYCAGNYDQHHMPPVYKTYYYPKPWEVLPTGARADFASTKTDLQRVPSTTTNIDSEVDSNSKPSDQLKTDKSSNKSDEKPSSKENSEGKSDADKNEDGKREVVPSPSDKTSSRTTVTKPRPVTMKPSTKKAS